MERQTETIIMIQNNPAHNPKRIPSFTYSSKTIEGENVVIYPATTTVGEKAFHRCINYEGYRHDKVVKSGKLKRVFIPYDTELSREATINMVCDDYYGLTGKRTKLLDGDNIEFVVYSPIEETDYHSARPFYPIHPLISITYPTLLANRFSEDLEKIKTGRFDIKDKSLAAVTIRTYNGFEIPRFKCKKYKPN